jgi:hypothetical protein
MAANKRTKAQRQLDLEKLSEMHLEGKSQNEMAQALGISQPQVCQELKKLDERWQKDIANTDLYKAREVAKLNHLERLNYEAFKRSREDKETKIAEKTTVGEANRTKAVSRQEKRDGNPAFLAGAKACIDKRCALLGINATDPAVEKEFSGELTDPERLARLAALFERGRSCRDGQAAADGAGAPVDPAARPADGGLPHAGG